MTTQSPEIFVNEHPRLDLGDLHVYRLIRGNPDDLSTWESLEFPVQPEHPPDTVVCSANWNGYTATLRLNADGTLTLVQFEFVTNFRRTGNGALEFETDRVVQTADALIPGDFWLSCSATFGGSTTYIPFCGGVIVEDESQWKHWEPSPTMSSEAARIRSTIDHDRRALRNSETKRVLRTARVDAPRKHNDQWWIVYNTDPVVCFDPTLNQYARLDANGNITVVGDVNKLISSFKLQ